MDAMKFIMTKNRMCKENMACKGCPLSEHKLPCNFASINSSELKEMMEIVEQWGKEHPQKTYKDDFLEKFPNAKIVNYIGGQAPDFCRNLIYSRGNCEISKGCFDCWNEPMEE